MQQQYDFNDIFREYEGGSVMPLRVINVNGIVIGPGVVIHPGVPIGGIDLTKLRGRTLTGIDAGGTFTIQGYYGAPINF